MNLITTRVCSLPSYPGVDKNGPVVLTYLEDQQVLVACGSLHRNDQSCYQLQPHQHSGWQTLGAGPLVSHFCPEPLSTRSHLLEAGWFLFGQKDQCGGSGAAISTELLTPQLQWFQPQIVAPFDDEGYPGWTCSVTINSSTIIITGGWNGEGWLSSTWMLDLTDYTWTQLTDMPEPRSEHGCTITATGELIIAGGGGKGASYMSTVYIYNLMSNTWDQAGDLPTEIDPYYPVMFLWNKHPILLEWLSSNIWILDGITWKKMEATMGATFDGQSDTAITVPNGIFTC